MTCMEVILWNYFSLNLSRYWLFWNCFPWGSCTMQLWALQVVKLLVTWHASLTLELTICPKQWFVDLHMKRSCPGVCALHNHPPVGRRGAPRGRCLLRTHSCRLARARDPLITRALSLNLIYWFIIGSGYRLLWQILHHIVLLHTKLLLVHTYYTHECSLW